MHNRGMDVKTVLTGAVLAALIGAASPAAAAAAANPNPQLANGVTHVASLEPPPTQYIVANPTNIFSNHFYYGTTVTGMLQRGQRVETLGKVPGYEWVLVGRNGVGIGYVPISMLSPADKYIP